MRTHQKAEHLELRSLETERRRVGKDDWIVHVLASDRLFIAEVLHLNRYSFDFVSEHVLPDQTRVTMSLDLQLELVKVDVLKIEVILPLNHPELLWAEFCSFAYP